jgi:hypothetical protein
MSLEILLSEAEAGNKLHSASDDDFKKEEGN